MDGKYWITSALKPWQPNKEKLEKVLVEPDADRDLIPSEFHSLLEDAGLLKKQPLKVEPLAFVQEECCGETYCRDGFTACWECGKAIS